MGAKQNPSILHICKVYLPVKGGVQKVVELLTGLLRNFSHHVMTTGEDGAIAKQRIREVSIQRCRSYGQLASMPIAPSLVPNVVKQVSQHQLLALHYPFPLADLALLFSFSRTPLVVHWHSNIVAQKRLRWIVAPLTWMVLLRCKAIVATSDLMIEHSWFLRQFRDKCRIIPYGMQMIHPLREPEKTQRSYFALVGRHVSYKGMDVAIKALLHCECELLIVGDGPLFERHEQLVGELGLQSRVSFLRQASDDQVIAAIQNAIALVVSSNLESEAFALVQIEAMQLSKAIINAQLKSSVPWVARNEKEALTVPPNDSPALAAAMHRLESDPKLAARLGKNGLARYQERFSSERFAKSIDELYHSIIEGSA